MSRVKQPVPIAVLLGVSVAGAAFATFRIGGWGDPQTIRAVNDLTLLCFGIAALVCAVSAARSNSGRQRRPWVFLAMGIGAWVLGVACWNYYNLILGLDATPYPLLGLLAFVLPISGCLALLYFPVGYTGQSHIRLLLDGVIVEGSLFLISWMLVMNRLYQDTRIDVAALNVTVAASVADMITLTVAIMVLVRARTGQRLVVSLLTAGLAVMAVADIVFVKVIALHTYDDSRFVAALWAVAILILGVAALFGRRAGHVTSPRTSLPSALSMSLPYVPLILAGVVAGVTTRQSLLMGPVVPIGMALVIVVLVRQFLVIADNRRLLSVVADQAMRDPLTGLANRALFHDHLAHAVSRHRRDKRPLAVLSLDLDDFKVINDSMGHPVGDAFLKAMAERLNSCVRAADTVARVGGDEFVVLIEGAADDSHLVARRVVAAFEVPFDVDGQELLLQPSFGLAVTTPEDRNITGEVLLKRADAAMYSAKRLRSGGLHTFSAGMDGPDQPYRGNWTNPRSPHDGAVAVRLLGELRRAIAYSDLVTVYQPKFDLRSNEIVGLEALVRWPHPDRGILTPEEFLPLVREHGLMRDVTEHVVERTLDDALNWYQNGEGVPVAVNLFAASLGDLELPGQILDALAARDLHPQALIVEITEDLLVDDMTRARSVLHSLRDAGVQISLDDFGSGYSALRNLRELPIDELKLDHDFIASLLTDQRAAAIVRAVIDLARDLGVATVAEGLENAETAERLLEYGCDMAQGFYYCAPIGAPEVLELLNTTPTRL